MSFSLLDLIIYLPMLIGAFLILSSKFLSDSSSKIIARLGAIISIWLSLQLFCCHGATVVNRAWIPSIGASYILSCDFISSLFLSLTAFILFVITFWWPKIDSTSPKLIGLLFLTMGSLCGVFLAKDLLLFYLFWELMLIPAFIAIGIYGGRRRIFSTLFFVVYTIISSILMLGASVYLALKHQQEFGTPSFALEKLIQLTILSPREQIFLAGTFLLAFLVKLPAWPLHAWLPHAYNESPYSFTVFLASMIGKAGFFGLVAIALPLFGVGFQSLASYMAFLGIVAVLYGALTACAQTELKLIFAYSSLSHLGSMLFAVASGSKIALIGAIFFAASHSLSVALLFILGGSLKELTGIFQLSDASGLAKKHPKLAVLFFFGILSGIGFPLTAPFIGELLIFVGTFEKYPVYSFLAMTGVIFSAVYMLTMFIRIMWGPEQNSQESSLVRPEFEPVQKPNYSGLVFATVPLIIAIFVLGIYPTPIIHSLESSLVSIKGLTK